MSAKEYKEYQDSVAEFFEREGIQNLSHIPDTDPYFSWSWCDCCSRPLGGDRYDCNGWNPKEREVQEYSVCVDCVYYAEYSRLDDMTMLEVEKTA